MILIKETTQFQSVKIFLNSKGRKSEKTIGSEGMESKLIGTVARCEICEPSAHWLGKYSPKAEICNGKLWLSQGLKSSGVSEKDKDLLDSAFQ